MFSHGIQKLLEVDGEPSAQQEDEDVVENPIIQAVGQEGLQQGILWKIRDEVIEGSVETGNVVESDLEKEETQEAHCSHAAHHRDPQGHEEIEPEEDHEEVEMVLGQPEEKELEEFQATGKLGTVEDDVRSDVEEGPEKVGNENGAEAPLHEVHIVKGFVDV